jgi:hypothetical protein
MVTEAEGDRVTDPSRTHLAERYGRRRGRRRPVPLLAGGLLVAAGLAWLGWVAVEHANPPVASRLLSFEVVSATAATATIQVDRTGDIAADCRLQAKASDFSIVGEATVTVPAEAPRRHVLTTSISTQREATSVVLIGCTTARSDRPR